MMAARPTEGSSLYLPAVPSHHHKRAAAPPGITCAFQARKRKRGRWKVYALWHSSSLSGKILFPGRYKIDFQKYTHDGPSALPSPTPPSLLRSVVLLAYSLSASPVMPAVVLYSCAFQGTVRSKLFSLFFVFVCFLCIISVKRIINLLQYSVI